MIKNIGKTTIGSFLSNYFKIANVQKCNYFLLQLPFIKDKHTFFKPLSLVRQISKKEASKKIQELLNVNLLKARCIVSNDNNFIKMSMEDLKKNYYLCLEQGLSKQTMENYPSILVDAALLPKLVSLKKLLYEINLTAPLLLFSMKKLNGFIDEELETKRIEKYAKLFQVDVCEVCKWLSAKPFLTSLNIDNVKECVKLLIDSGVTLQAIINDLWVLRYSPGVVEERIKLAKDNNIDKIKTWMIRAQRDIFDNYVRRRSDTKEILGDKHDLVEYLSEKLECSAEISIFLISKQPALQKKSLRKMNEMIDFLLAHGFKPIHICRTPKILLHSVETIRKRLRELETNNVHLDSLHILTKSQRQYMSVIESMKANKSKLKNYNADIFI